MRVVYYSSIEQPWWRFVSSRAFYVRKLPECLIGNMFPGVALPFGQVKLGIDTSVVNLDQGGISSANSGYTPLGNSTGFSMLHTSGTGGR